jgi:hypothetical protein
MGDRARRPLLTLTTDFGTRDSYVAAMKGVVLSRVRDATIVDVTHDIPPQGVREAARTLLEAVRTFPPDTVHVAVIDPGVGSERRILCVASALGIFLAPDNGVLTRVLDAARRRDTAPEVFAVERPDLSLGDVSATFHGRDIFAPVAAHLLLGLAPCDLGPPVTDPVRLSLEVARRDDATGRIDGEVVHVDRFGNLVTNVSERLLPEHRSRLAIEVGSVRLEGMVASYAALARERPGALIESSGHLEIAVAGGSAAEILGLGVGARVVVLCR